MDSLFAQIVITIWMSVHPVRYTLPKIYFAGEGQCERHAQAIAQRVKPKARVEIECVSTDHREI